MIKKATAFLITAILIFTLAFSVCAEGTATAISTLSQLKALSGKTGSFYLANDITVPQNEAAFSPISDFNGTLDGNGKKISGLTIKGDLTATSGYIGLFAVLKGSGKVKNLTLENVKVECSAPEEEGYIYVGAIAGSNKGTIENCRVSGRVLVNSPKATVYVGGIAGSNGKRIRKLENYANIDVKAAAVYAGGITGDHSVSINSIEKCINRGEIIVSGNRSNSYGGGIAGKTAYTIENCANYGTVYVFSDIDSYSGGIAGYISDGNITKCYNAGKIRCNSTREMFWDAIVAKAKKNDSVFKDYCYYLSGSVEGKSDKDVKTAKVLSADETTKKSSFNFDFTGVWDISDGTLTLREITAAIPKVLPTNPEDNSPSGNVSGSGNTSSTASGSGNTSSAVSGSSNTSSATQGETQGAVSGENVSGSTDSENEYIPSINVSEAGSGSTGSQLDLDSIDFTPNKAAPIWLFVVLTVVLISSVCIFLYFYKKNN